MKRSLHLPMLALTFALTACSGADLLNSLVPGDGYHVIRDLRYGDGPRRTLDLYVPEGAAPAAPNIVFFYGGGWESGSKDDFVFVGQAFASRGYVTAIPDYRVYPEARFPMFLEDAAAAVAWVRANTDQTRAAAGPVYLVGHSAGAHIAAMLTLDNTWLAEVGNKVCEAIVATAGLAGPYDFLPLRSATLKDIFGSESSRPQTQPINHVDGTAPPMLLITGTADTTVLPRNSARLAARIRNSGGIAEERSYDGIGHIELVASLAVPLHSLAPALDDIDRFFRRHPVGGSSCRGSG
jgi:acetyl esterase/lipase